MISPTNRKLSEWVKVVGLIDVLKKNVSRAWNIVGIHCIFAEGQGKWINSELGTCFYIPFLESIIMFTIISSGRVYLCGGTHGKFRWFLSDFFSLSEKRCSQRCRPFFSPERFCWVLHKTSLGEYGHLESVFYFLFTLQFIKFLHVYCLFSASQQWWDRHMSVYGREICDSEKFSNSIKVTETTEAEPGLKPRSSDAKASILSCTPQLPSGTW